MIDGLGSDRGFLIGVLVVAFVWRLFVGVLTGMPSEDGANYLWMAERFAESRADLALAEVFPPLYPLCIAPFVALGLEPFRAGQIVAALAGAASLFVAIRITERFFSDGGKCVGCMLVFAPLPVRFGAEIYTSPLFHCVGGFALLAGLRGSYWIGGAVAGLAFWVRPEAALIPVALAVTRRGAWRMFVPFAVFVLLLGAWRWGTGNGFVVEAKAALHHARLWPDGWSFGAWVVHFGGNAIRIPWLWVEAFGLVGLLAIWGVLGPKRRDLVPLLVLVALAVLVICDFLARRRFLVAWTFVVAPLAVGGLARLPARGRLPVLIVIAVTSALLSLRLQESNRRAELVVGEYLAKRLEPGERIASDMTRVLYFAGQRPLPPRHFSVDELVAMARASGVRYLVLGSKRPTAQPVVDRLEGEFDKHVLPEIVRREWVEERGILVLERR